MYKILLSFLLILSSCAERHLNNNEPITKIEVGSYTTGYLYPEADATYPYIDVEVVNSGTAIIDFVRIKCQLFDKEQYIDVGENKTYQTIIPNEKIIMRIVFVEIQSHNQYNRAEFSIEIEE